MRHCIWIGLILLSGCLTAPPGTDDVGSLGHVELFAERPRRPRVRVFHTADVERREAESLLPQVAAICSEVHAVLGFAPPRTELILYQPSAPAGARGRHVHETRGDLVQEETGWRIRFVYPWRGEQGLGQLWGTTAHEVAEATILLRVTVLDPYVRWMHDGIADLVEHEVLARLQPALAAKNLKRTLRFLAERRAAGVRRVDVRRWRQLSPFLVRSHRYLGAGETNLVLDDRTESLRRVRKAKTRTDDPVFLEGLGEIEKIFLHAGDVERQVWRADEARPGDPLTQDFLFYNVSFALWLHVERERPGTLKEFVRLIAARRSEDDHVLTGAEVESLLKQAAQGLELPDLSNLLVTDAEAWLKAEARRISSHD